MLRGRFHLCQYMPRCKDARRLDADPANEPNFYAISAKYPVEERRPVAAGVASAAATPQVPINLVNNTTPSPGAMIPAPKPSDISAAPFLAQLLSIVQAVPKSQPNEIIQLPPLPSPPVVPQAPLEQLVALVSSVATSVPTPSPTLPDPVTTALLLTLLAVMGATSATTSASPTVVKPPPPVNNSNNVAPNDIVSMLNQVMTTNAQPNDNDVVGNVVKTLIQKQQEQQEAAKLAAMLAMCLNPSGSLASTK
uniref:Uncharacterized protein n=2 Tax=Amphora coffeiformis TaxID=265554 RepID=A0A7S3KXD8_9STRA